MLNVPRGVATLLLAGALIACPGDGAATGPQDGPPAVGDGAEQVLHELELRDPRYAVLATIDVVRLADGALEARLRVDTDPSPRSGHVRTERPARAELRLDGEKRLDLAPANGDGLIGSLTLAGLSGGEHDLTLVAWSEDDEEIFHAGLLDWELP